MLYFICFLINQRHIRSHYNFLQFFHYLLIIKLFHLIISYSYHLKMKLNLKILNQNFFKDFINYFTPLN